MNILEKIKSGTTFFDGGMGTLLQERGLLPGELPETWNLSKPDVIKKIHKEYLAAGCDILTTNTFGANNLKFDNCGEIIEAAVAIAKQAVAESGREAFVAYDMGPTGKLLKPLGDLDFEDAVALFAENVRAADAAGADLILIETMNDSYETKAAVLAAKENSSLPVFVTNVYDGSGKLMTGATPEAMAALLEGLRVDAIGMNCSLGPEQMLSIVPRLVAATCLPVIVNPNAGLPRSEGGRTVYDVGAEEFSDLLLEIAKAGATIVGGCCGTTPDYIEKSVQKIKDLPIPKRNSVKRTVVSSYTHAVEIGKKPVLIGERINPTGKKLFKQALRDGDIAYVLSEGIKQEERGAHLLDVNVGLPEIDEVAMLTEIVKQLQGVCDLPLQIDTVNFEAMESAMRIYNGKPLVNSVNGSSESMEHVFPLMQKYGGTVIALTMDESGIPETAEGRLSIARRIVEKAADYGIAKEDIVADPLAMTVSSDQKSALVTLEAIRLIKKELGIACSLGVSNISFGLPNRDLINGTFFAMALQNGLDCAIMNPFSAEMMKTYYSFCALSDMDANCADYIAFAPTVSGSVTGAAVTATGEMSEKKPLFYPIVKGLVDAAKADADELLKTMPPLELINDCIIPALDEVGRGFENKTLYLPQLLMSADAAKAAFEVLKSKLPADSVNQDKKIVLATVKGDIHDIGKNIVKVLLENFGFHVLDLGRDVPPEKVVETALAHDCRMVGLSALMTTTVPAMEETVKLLHEALPGVQVAVGGAVLTKEYADMIGADRYCADAMETVRYAEEIFGKD